MANNRLIPPPGKNPADTFDWLGIFAELINEIKGTTNYFDKTANNLSNVGNNITNVENKLQTEINNIDAQLQSLSAQISFYLNLDDNGLIFAETYRTAGASDDLVLERALAACRTDAGNIVIVNKPNYNITKRIQLPKGVYLMGLGNVKFTMSGGYGVAGIQCSQDNIIENINFINTPDSSSSVITLQRCAIWGLPYGPDETMCRNIIIRNCYFENFFYAVNFRNEGTDTSKHHKNIIISHNRAKTYQDDPVKGTGVWQLRRCEDMIFDGNYSEGGTTAASIGVTVACGIAVITNNIVKYNMEASIQLENFSQSLPEEVPINCIISNNKCDGCIWIDDVESVTCTGNICDTIHITTSEHYCDKIIINGNETGRISAKNIYAGDPSIHTINNIIISNNLLRGLKYKWDGQVESNRFAIFTSSCVKKCAILGNNVIEGIYDEANIAITCTNVDSEYIVANNSCYTTVYGEINGKINNDDGEIHVEDWGILPQSESIVTPRNDGPMIQTFINYLKRIGGGRLIFPKGRYYITGTSSLRLYSNISIEGVTGATIFDFSKRTNYSAVEYKYLISAFGTLGTKVRLTTDGNKGDYKISLPSVGFTEGDLILISSTDVWDDPSMPCRCGELTQIRHIPNSVEMMINNPLFDNYLVSKTAYAIKVTPQENITIKGITVLGKGRNKINNVNNADYGIGLTHCKNVTIKDVSVNYVDTIGVEFRSCYEFLMDNCHFYTEAYSTTDGNGRYIVPLVPVAQSTRGAVQYQVRVGCASMYGTIVNCTGVNSRHFFNTGHGDRMLDGTNTVNVEYLAGVNRNITVDNCVSRNTWHAGFSTHSASENIEFRNCTAIGSGASGFNPRSKNLTLNNCYAYNSATAFYVYDYAENIIITNCKSKFCTCGVNFSSAIDKDFKNITIMDNIFEETTTGILINTGITTAQTGNILIKNNTISSGDDRSGTGIYFNYLKGNTKIVNNTIVNTKYGMRFLNSNRVDLGINTMSGCDLPIVISGSNPRLLTGFTSLYVTDFGACGDGVTDDTASIKLAMEVCRLLRVELYFPSGTYMISDTLEINKDMHLRGAGRRTTIIKKLLGNNTYMLKSYRYDVLKPGSEYTNVPMDFSIDEMTFDGNYMNVNASNVYDKYINNAGGGILIYGRQFKINCEIVNQAGIGLSIMNNGSETGKSPYMVKDYLINCEIRDCKEECFIQSKISDGVIEKLWARNAGARIASEENNAPLRSPNYGSDSYPYTDNIIFDNGCGEIDCIHSWGCLGGKGLRTIGTVRIHANLIIGESCRYGGAYLAGGSYGDINTIDIHGCGGGKLPGSTGGLLPDLQINSTRPLNIANCNLENVSTVSTGQTSCLLNGSFTNIANLNINKYGRDGDGLIISGSYNTVSGIIQNGVNGFVAFTRGNTASYTNVDLSVVTYGTGVLTNGEINVESLKVIGKFNADQTLWSGTPKPSSKTAAVWSITGLVGSTPVVVK